MKIVLIAGSPAASSRGTLLLDHVAASARARGIEATLVEVRTLPSDAMLAGRVDEPALAAAIQSVADAQGVVVSTPVYKAAYTGLLKCFLDLFPVEETLRGKIVFPIATAAAPTHVLALDYALKPVLASLGATLTSNGFWALDGHFDKADDGTMSLKAEHIARLDAALAGFLHTIEAGPLPKS